MLIINTQSHTIEVDIQTSRGTETIFISPKGRVETGDRPICNDWYARNMKSVRVPDLEKKEKAAVSPVRNYSSTSNSEE
jgi:hypothetical protein